MFKMITQVQRIFIALRVWIQYLIVKNNPRFQEDLQVWVEWKQPTTSSSRFGQFVCLMCDYKEFRNIAYYRMGKAQYLLRWLCPPLDSLYIHCKDIGGGFRIQHGFATIINAERIGKNVKIFQQVTIGYNGDKRPVIGDNVEICCGAKVLGGITIGNDVIIGAQALIVKDIDSQTVMGGVLAQVVRRK